MEFLELCLLLYVSYLVYKKPEKEKLAFNLLAFTAILVAFVFYAIDIQYNVLPAFNL
ncbi:DsbI-accessory protein Dba [Malaciobacter marinus]|uniref:DsbI-accessory protein Dba n=1 Tax=Malaciobacter marinus TaxID=505249 RepID=A0A347THC1_9BACT|nr:MULTISPECIES: hypothetical protein [Malaciobacter]AXH08590.1 DsbI-accessory protein Dba [Malaciobacter halophilus]AXX85999.1 DsbI-accessory protein Dba [Malaciobacter marinus]